VKSTAHAFDTKAPAALRDTQLQTAMARAYGGFVYKRRTAVEALPEFAALQRTAQAIKEHTLEHLDYYLERFEAQVQSRGGQVHWARTSEEACTTINEICHEQGAQTVIKGKSMVGEEIALNESLEASGLQVTETDLGEYIIQLAKEPPSHIIAPAVHKTRTQIAELFDTHHRHLGRTGQLTEVAEIVDEARAVLRQAFLSADVGITGANLLIAQTGSVVLVTNEGNGDLASTLPRTHIVVASLEKIVPTLEDASTLLRVLGRSATGQELTSYTTFVTGSRREGDLEGPEDFHVVLVDHGRAEILGSEYRDILRCIRCGACLNHCPVYSAIGGHAYGWVYPGPMGAVLTPLMVGLKEAYHLPNACTLNGRCEEVCPMGIPLPQLLRRLRTQAFEDQLPSRSTRLGLSAWSILARRPWLYHALTAILTRVLAVLGRKQGRLRTLPFAGGWTRSRDFPVPQGPTFHAVQKRRKPPGS
jgi:L-lactate dehydrogenase complex protein LldF